MHLSKTEYKYRIKFIQECHYNKEEQRIFDKAVATMSETYKGIYKSMRNGYVYTFMVLIASNQMSRAVCNIGVTVERMTESMQALSKEFSEMKGW